ncbi:MAG TPA: hypothetical protein VN282_20665 [Pyrinomonadaceae bacterium]|nr:hypothetical protein [Pyrinomonadaceae bacterium]
MLFVERRTADLNVEKNLRTPVLEVLRQRGFAPLIRSARLHLFEQAATGPEQARELERALEERAAAEGEEPYVHGDLFCFEDFVHYLIFGDGLGGGAGLRAGIVYDAETVAPAERLEAFCRNVREAYEEAARVSKGSADGAEEVQSFEWRSPAADSRGGAEDSSVPAQQPAAVTPERARGGEILEDAAARGFLQRLSEAHTDGRAAEFVAAGRGPEQESLVERLTGAGLVRREVQVSCRKTGRSLFRLPSTEALSIVTASNAVCSECGSAVADERAEELVTPTPLASSLLKDGAWLLSSLRAILAGLGVPEGQTRTREAHSEGEAQLAAHVSGEPFLFVLRDGDFTGAHARRAIEGESEATRMVVVAAGKVHDEARARLREHARRRARAGGEAEVVFVEGLETAADELRPLVERVAQDALTRELYELDADAGFDVGYALAARFRLAQQRRDGALQDLAASAAGALSGVLNSRQ